MAGSRPALPIQPRRIVRDAFLAGAAVRELSDFLPRHRRAAPVAHHPQPFSPEPRDEFSGWKDQPLKGARAWAMPERFSPFWEYQAAGGARRFFKDWFGWVSRRPLQPMADVARRLQRPLENRLTYLRHHITNAVTEGLNSKIQSIKSLSVNKVFVVKTSGFIGVSASEFYLRTSSKSAARGFRNFQNDRIRILFFCGKLNLYPL
jgi:hypothetical protein